MKNNIKAVIFDLNGTLLNSKKMLIKSRLELFNNVVKNYPNKKQEILNDFRSFLNGNSMNPDILNNLNIKLSDNQKKELYKKFNISIKNNLKLQKNTLELFFKLQQNNIKIIIWSNSRTPFVIDLIHRFHLNKYIDSIYCNQKKPNIDYKFIEKINENKFTKNIHEFNHSHKKPSKYGLNFILEKENLMCKEALLIGNGIDSDGISAKSCKVPFILTKWGNIKNSDQKKLDFLIKTESESVAERNFIKIKKKNAMKLVNPIMIINDLKDVLKYITND